MTKNSVIFGLTGFCATLIGFAAKAFYRNYILSNSISDFGIQGFLPSYFYVMGFSLLLLVKPTKFPSLVIFTVALASVLFEIKQFIANRNFDWKDTLASIAGGLTALVVVKMLETTGKK